MREQYKYMEKILMPFYIKNISLGVGLVSLPHEKLDEKLFERLVTDNFIGEMHKELKKSYIKVNYIIVSH